MVQSGIYNVKIVRADLGDDDHGGIGYMLILEGSFGGQGFGGYRIQLSNVLDPFNAFGIYCVRRILEVTGVRQWNDLPGTIIRVKYIEGVYDPYAIGHIIEDRWFTPKEEWQQFDRMAKEIVKDRKILHAGREIMDISAEAWKNIHEENERLFAENGTLVDEYNETVDENDRLKLLLKEGAKHVKTLVIENNELHEELAQGVDAAMAYEGSEEGRLESHLMDPTHGYGYEDERGRAYAAMGDIHIEYDADNPPMTRKRRGILGGLQRMLDIERRGMAARKKG